MHEQGRLKVISWVARALPDNGRYPAVNNLVVTHSGKHVSAIDSSRIHEYQGPHFIAPDGQYQLADGMTLAMAQAGHTQKVPQYQHLFSGMPTRSYVVTHELLSDLHNCLTRMSEVEQEMRRLQPIVQTTTTHEFAGLSITSPAYQPAVPVTIRLGNHVYSARWLLDAISFFWRWANRRSAEEIAIDEVVLSGGHAAYLHMHGAVDSLGKFAAVVMCGGHDGKQRDEASLETFLGAS